MSWLMAAGAVLANPANAPVSNTEVQMLAATYDSFTHWTFVWQTALEVEILMLAALFFIYRPYIPIIISKIWTHLPIVGVMNRVRNIAPFGGFILRNGMYRKEWRDNIMYYVKKYLGSYHFMGVAFDIVHIDRGFVQDPYMNKYICTLADAGYNTVGDMENAMVFNNIDPKGEDYTDEDGNLKNTTNEIVSNMGFDSYESARKSLNPSNINTSSLIYAPRFSNIPIDSLLGYGADIAPGSIAAQVDDIFEYRKPPEEEDRLLELMPFIILIMAMVIGAVMIISVIRQ